MAIIYSYPETLELLPTDMLIGTSTIKVAGKRKNITKNFTLELLKDFILDGLPAVQWGSITGTLSNQTDLQTALNNKQNNITLTTTGTSGAATFVGSTLNIPNYSSVTYSFTSPLVNTSGVVSITQSNATTNGYLSSTDWNTFNSKQTALSGTGFVKISGTTISYDNTTYYPYPTGTISEYVRGDGSLATFPTATIPTLNQVLTAGNVSLLDAKIGDLYLYDPTEFDYGYLSLNDSDFSFSDVFGQAAVLARSGIVLSGTPGGFYGNILLPSVTNNRTYTLPDASGTIALTSDIPAAVTSVGATSPITSSGGTTPTISTSMSTNKLIGRSTAGTGVMEEITVGTGLTLSAGTLSTTTVGGTIPHATASGTDTYTVTVTGVSSYADGDAYLIRFTNGNTTGCTLNINGLGAIPLYRNNDGALIGGDIWADAEMLCVYNSTSNVFQCIGTSSNSLFSYITNADTVPITKGQPVYAFGGTGDRLTVKRAFNTSDAGSARTIGVVLSSSIAVNQKGIIIIEGLLDGLNILPTATWSDGDTVYLGTTAGSITNIKQYAPNHLVYLGTVTTASNGSSGRWYVKVQNGYELDELHNVQAQTPSLKDTLWYDNTVSPAQWKTASISTILGYTPVTNARTISTTSPLQGGGDLTADRTLSILQSSAIQDGYLSSTDWSTFNGKQNAITLTTTGSSGAATLIGSTLNIPQYGGGTVTSVAALTLGTTGTDLSSTVANGTTTPVITLNVPTASATNRGALSSADWSTFNSKFTLPSLTNGSVLFSNGTTIAQDNANFFWDDTNNRLGIGTTSPSAKLHVDGSMYLEDTATSVESITFSQGPQIVSDGPSGYFRTGQVYTNTITSNVGIGTSTPAYKLNLYGSTALYNIGTNSAFAANTNYFVGHGLDASTPANITSKIGFISDASVGQFSDAIAFYTTPTTFSPVNSDASTERMRITNSGNVGIGTTTPNASSILDVTSTTQGFLPPRMTTTQRNAIASPATGLVVYDTTLLSLYQYNGTAWTAVGGGGTSNPSVIDLKAVNGTAVTGTTADTLSQSLLIAANTFSSDGILEIICRMSKTGTASTSNVRIYKNTSNTLTGATLIASNTTITGTNIFSQMIRTFRINSNTLTGYSFGTSSLTDYQSTSSTSSTTFTTNVDNYIIFSIQLGNAADSANISMARVIKSI